jgi:FKBP-type peptidyl-prolyl cis-trans isomerase SlyD
LKVENEKVVTLMYELRDGKAPDSIIEATTIDNPLQFVFGTGMMLEAFESNIKGLNVDEQFKFTLAANDAYGERKEEAVVKVPKATFQNNSDLLQVGLVVAFNDQQGNNMPGTIKEIQPESVLVDFNHPLAGVDLNFTGKIIEVRQATETELMQGLHGCGGGSCGCDSGGCDSCQ